MMAKIKTNTQVFPINQKCYIYFTTEGLEDGEYKVRCIPMSFNCITGFEMIEIVDGCFNMPMVFVEEQEYVFYLYKEEKKVVAEISVYALKEDLFELTPIRGDFHIHSNCSDGKEDPSHVAAYCRMIGLDIAAVTDHHRFQPSLTAIDTFKDVSIDLCLCTGEEVHPPKTNLHIIHFGGNESINDMFETQAYKDEIIEIEKNLPELAPYCDRMEYAASIFVFKTIEKTKGLSIFCHPYWLSPHFKAKQIYNISEGVTNQTFIDRPFDAYELLGGYFLDEQHSNVLQISRYIDENAIKPLPIVGVSDAHGCIRGELFGWYSTISFSKDNSFESVKSSIKNCLSVAVEALPEREIRAYGPHRLVAYSLFLLRTYYLVHDEFCKKEGEAMLRYAKGDKNAKAELESLSGQVKLLNVTFFYN